MTRILIVLVLGIGIGSLVAAPAEKPADPSAKPGPDPAARAARGAGGWWSGEASQLVFFAVLEGLYEDGVSQEIVDKIVPPHVTPAGNLIDSAKAPIVRDTNIHFIYTCPLCHPTSEAFLLYAARQPFRGQKVSEADTFGKTALPEATEKKLRSDKHAVRLEGLREAMDRWVGRRLDLMQLSVDERKVWEQKIKALRDQGNQALTQFQNGSNGDYFKNMYAGWKFCAACDGSAAGCKIVRPAHE
jgi:hypothetical protein